MPLLICACMSLCVLHTRGLRFKLSLIVQANMQYACRKTLADSRPRVRGRFAKNDDFGETHRPACSNHEDDEDDEVILPTLLKHMPHLISTKNFYFLSSCYIFLILIVLSPYKGLLSFFFCYLTGSCERGRGFG